MTALAFGWKWGRFGDSGFSGPDGFGAASALPASSKEARAIEPRPRPHWRKNQRRVMNLADSRRSSSLRFIGSFLGDCLIEVQNGPRYHRPSGRFVQVDIGR